MVRHNNMVATNHFHKAWQARARTWFAQPLQKRQRRLRRARRQLRLAPRPARPLRPLVRCPSARYNAKARAGRGFALAELRAAGVNRALARTLGVAVDQRRRGGGPEATARNARRLRAYMARLVLLPRKAGAAYEQAGGKMADLQKSQFAIRALNLVKAPAARVPARKVSEAERKFEAFATLRKARSEGKHHHKRLIRKRETKQDDNV